MAMANGVTTTADAEMLAATAADLTTVASLKAADAPKVAVTAVDVEMPAVDAADLTAADAEMLAATEADLTAVAGLKAADAPKVAVTAVDVEMPAVDVAAEMIVVTGVDAETTVDAIVAEDAPRSSLIRP